MKQLNELIKDLTRQRVDEQSDGDIAYALDRIINRLVSANRRDDKTRVTEIRQLIDDLRDYAFTSPNVPLNRKRIYRGALPRVEQLLVNLEQTEFFFVEGPAGATRFNTLDAVKAHLERLLDLTGVRVFRASEVKVKVHVKRTVELVP